MDNKRTVLNKVIIMLCCIIITVATLNEFAKLIQHLINIQYDWKFELCMVVGQLVFQFPFIFRRTSAEKMNYYFDMLMVSMIGSLLLLPLFLFNHFYPIDSLLSICYFFAVVLFMFFEHKKRVRKLDLPSYISYTWVLYRFLILIFILI